MFFGRGKNKIQNPYVMKDFYNFYVNETEDNDLYETEYNDYVNIVNDFYKTMVDYVLLKSGKFILPFGLGDIFVIKRKVDLDYIDHKALDWKTTNQTGKRVYHLNEHTGGYKYFYHWDKSRSRLNKLYLYRFQLTRTNKRRLAKLVKSGKHDYFEKW